MESYIRSIKSKRGPEKCTSLPNKQHPSVIDYGLSLSKADTSQNPLVEWLRQWDGMTDENLPCVFHGIDASSTEIKRGNTSDTVFILVLRRLIHHLFNQKNTISTSDYNHELLLYYVLSKNGEQRHFESILSYISNAVPDTDYRSVDGEERPQLYKDLCQLGSSSTELNMAVIEFFYTNLPFYSRGIFDRFKKMIGGFVESNRQTNITVFHGTNFELGKEFTTYTFLSTTIDINIARSYGNIVYVLSVPKHIPYIKLESHNKHVLLPFGCTFRVMFGIPAANPAFYFCECVSSGAAVMKRIGVVESIVRGDHFQEGWNSTFLQGVPTNFQKETPKCSTKRIKSKYSPYYVPSNLSVSIGFSDFCSMQYVGEDYFCKKPKCKRTREYIRRRYTNEILALRLYKFFDVTTLQDEMLIFEDRENNLWLGSRYVENVDLPQSLLLKNVDQYVEGYLVDCVMANWDIYNKGNMKIRSSDGDLVRSDVGGALAYRARGEFKLSFMDKRDPTEHLSMLQNSRMAECFKKYIDIFAKDAWNYFSKKMKSKISKDLGLFEFKDALESQIGDVLSTRWKYYTNNLENVCNSVIKSIIEMLPPTGTASGGTDNDSTDDCVFFVNTEALDSVSTKSSGDFDNILKIKAGALAPRSSGGSGGRRGRQSRTGSAPGSSGRGRTASRRT